MLVDGMTKADKETGKTPTEQEAQFAVKAVEKLHMALREWASK